MTATPQPTFAQRLAELKKPLPGSWLRWKRGRTPGSDRKDISPRAQALPYYSPARIADWLDETMGPERWSTEYRVGAAGVICRLGLRDDEGNWIFKENSGETSAAVKRGAASPEQQPKPSLGEAFLRAAMTWGIARYLWTFNAPWIVLVDGKVPRNTVIPVPNELLPENERSSDAAGKSMTYFVEEPHVIEPAGADAHPPAAPVSAPTPAPVATPIRAASEPSASSSTPPSPSTPAKRQEPPAQSADPWQGLELPGLDIHKLDLAPEVRSKVISIATSIKRTQVPARMSKDYINKPECALIPTPVREALIRLVDAQAAPAGSAT